MTLAKLFAYLFHPKSAEKVLLENDTLFYQTKVWDGRQKLQFNEAALASLGKQAEVDSCHKQLNTIESNLASSKLPRFEDASELFHRIEALYNLVRPYAPPGEEGQLVLMFMQNKGIDPLTEPQLWEDTASRFLSEHTINNKLGIPETVGGHSRTVVRELLGYLRQEAKKAA